MKNVESSNSTGGYDFSWTRAFIVYLKSFDKLEVISKSFLLDRIAFTDLPPRVHHRQIFVSGRFTCSITVYCMFLVEG